MNAAISTVGYGEITPRSFLGRLITIPILVFGLLTITLPSFVLGREFSIVWEKMTKNRVRFPSRLFRLYIDALTLLTSLKSKGKGESHISTQSPPLHPPIFHENYPTLS